VVLAFGHALRAQEALSCPDALPGFLEVVHRLFEHGVFIGHDRSIWAGILRSLDCFAFPVSTRTSLVGVAVGKHRVEVEDFDFSYGVYVNGRRVICFAEGRIGYREWATRSGFINPSVEDRLDHDVDELMA
jgi:hypothetical protein